MFRQLTTNDNTPTEEGMAKRQLVVFKCRQCNHRWLPRILAPALCPKCHSPYWDKPLRPKKSTKKPKK